MEHYIHNIFSSIVSLTLLCLQTHEGIYAHDRSLCLPLILLNCLNIVCLVFLCCSLSEEFVSFLSM